MADSQFNPLGTVTAPADWTLPASLNLQLKNVYASYDGTSAAGSFVPCLQIISDSGHTIGSYPYTSSIAAGGSADMTWFPSVGGAPAGVPAPYSVRYDETLTSPAAGFDTTGTDFSGGVILEVWVFSRSDRAGVGAGNLAFNFNGDTGANYDYVWIRNEGGTADIQNVHGATSIQGQTPGAVVTAGHFSILRATVPNYTGTAAFKDVEFTNGFSNPASTSFDRAILGTGSWDSTAAITSVQCTTVAGNLLTGSRMIVIER